VFFFLLFALESESSNFAIQGLNTKSWNIDTTISIPSTKFAPTSVIYILIQHSKDCYFYCNTKELIPPRRIFPCSIFVFASLIFQFIAVYYFISMRIICFSERGLPTYFQVYNLPFFVFIRKKRVTGRL